MHPPSPASNIEQLSVAWGARPNQLVAQSANLYMNNTRCWGRGGLYKQLVQYFSINRLKLIDVRVYHCRTRPRSP